MSKSTTTTFDGSWEAKMFKTRFLAGGQTAEPKGLKFFVWQCWMSHEYQPEPFPPWRYFHSKFATYAYCLWSNMLRYVASPVVRNCNESIAFRCLIHKKWWPSDKNGVKREFPLKNFDAIFETNFLRGRKSVELNSKLSASFSGDFSASAKKDLTIAERYGCLINNLVVYIPLSYG